MTGREIDGSVLTEEAKEEALKNFGRDIILLLVGRGIIKYLNYRSLKRGPTGNGGVLNNANYAQKTYSNTFSAEGIAKYSELAGMPINTIDDLVSAIKNGKINPADLPVEYIIRDGNTLILNTRTSQALTQAGIPRDQWSVIDRTGNSFLKTY